MQYLNRMIQDRCRPIPDHPSLQSHNQARVQVCSPYQQSQQYQTNSDTQPDNEKNRWKAKEAITICNKVISKFPESKGAEKCKILKQQIEQQSLQITTEKFLPILQNTRLLLRYKNLNELEFKVFKINRKQLDFPKAKY